MQGRDFLASTLLCVKVKIVFLFKYETRSYVDSHITAPYSKNIGGSLLVVKKKHEALSMSRARGTSCL